VSALKPVTPQKACGHVHARSDPPRRSHVPCDHHTHTLFEIGRTPYPFPSELGNCHLLACHSSPPSLVLAVGSRAETPGGRRPRSTEYTKALKPRKLDWAPAHSHTAAVRPVTQRVACKPGDLELSEDALAGRRNGSARQILTGGAGGSSARRRGRLAQGRAKTARSPSASRRSPQWCLAFMLDA